MESSLLAFITTLLEKGVLAESSLQLIIIGMLIYGYIYILKPMASKLQKVLTQEELGASFEKFNNKDDLNIDDLKKKLEKLIAVLDEIEDLDKGNYREIKELRRDIEHMKQIINQIQGHLLFGGRRSSDFGNRELK